ncbi:MAG: Unknown protein [uncultured Thiotrichaceae bacterium]|uniref:Transmembrane protein (PGPGW) n=1 Tax=uncultured Thiotrichaceae bacterium TaxID=298394 RepID=A0A6S6TLQ0_9GAMM|nr:MAG: Unknown protein [uncultured Thiotrichaceae bacterium]
MIEQLTLWFQQYQSVFAWGGLFSAITFVLSLLILPWLLSRIPVDYFRHHQPESSWAMLLTPRNMLRNILGLPVLLAGISMLILPGQGLITILLGLAIMKFPGKFALERWVVNRRGVLPAVNWLRKKAGASALNL